MFCCEYLTVLVGHIKQKNTDKNGRPELIQVAILNGLKGVLKMPINNTPFFVLSVVIYYKIALTPVYTKT
jgi:hypothetical protein